MKESLKWDTHRKDYSDITIHAGKSRHSVRSFNSLDSHNTLGLYIDQLFFTLTGPLGYTSTVDFIQKNPWHRSLDT